MPAGYHPFWVPVPGVTPATKFGRPPTNARPRELTVLADNRLDQHWAPTHLGHGDWYQFGGLTRPVTLYELPQRDAGRSGNDTLHGTYIERAETFVQATGGACKGGRCTCLGRLVLMASGQHFIPKVAKVLLRRAGGLCDAKKLQVKVAVLLGGTGRGSELSFPVQLVFKWDSETDPVRLHVLKSVPTNGRIDIGSLRAPQNARLWSVEDPHLHVLSIEMQTRTGGHTIDAVQVRIGLRTIAVNKYRRITINNESVKLVGFNRSCLCMASCLAMSTLAETCVAERFTTLPNMCRHSMWPESGASSSFSQIQKDVKLLKGAGANFVRGAHYPQDQRFLDLCDENGILVYEEALGTAVYLGDLKNVKSNFFREHLRALDAMVSASVNHPSVIIWGFFNEGPSDKEEVLHPTLCIMNRASVADIPANRLLLIPVENSLEIGVCSLQSFSGEAEVQRRHSFGHLG
eukprot:scaffold1042_cov401-Prasinococcus_capsulatus_cf.AAC.56